MNSLMQRQQQDPSLAEVHSSLEIDEGNLGAMQSYQIIMKDGAIDETLAEYINFKRQNVTRWGGLSQLIQQLEKLLSQYPVQMCILDSYKMVQLVEMELERYTRNDLLSCVSNLSAVQEWLNNPKKKFTGPNGPVLAAIKLQTAWRRHKAFTAYNQLKFLMAKATVIQRKYRLYQLKKSTKDKVNQLTGESINVWRDMQNEFKRCWPQIKQQSRFEIHINSYSISETRRQSIEKFK